MTSQSLGPGNRVAIERSDLAALLSALAARGYRLLGPTVRDGTIVHGELGTVDDLPIGWTDAQEAASYGLARRPDDAVFGFGPSAHSWKSYLQAPAQRMFRAVKADGHFAIEPDKPAAQPAALLGVRACDVHAMSLLDRVLLDGEQADPWYAARRTPLFVVAVNCDHQGANCFCFSMGTGPRVTTGFDIALTEIVKPSRHYFVAEIGTSAGAEVMRDVPHHVADDEERLAADCVAARMASQMGRSMDPTDLADALYRNAESAGWARAAARCTACGNCTSVCPTCACFSVDDTTDLSGEHAERWRRSDSCFTAEFSYVYGGSVRYSPAARFRQWITHKFAGWPQQFGSAGCVGCGRCITWCPVGIDITEEAPALATATQAIEETIHGDT